MTARIVCLSDLGVSISQDLLSDSVLCFGHFNTIHPGHIRYFRTALQYGRPLVVAIEGDAQILDTQGIQVFGEQERAQAVASLDVVDYVVILDSGPLEDFVRRVKISALVLGKEFESTRASKVSVAVSEMRQAGSEVFYDAGETHYASAELFHGTLGDIEKERWRMFQNAQKKQGISISEILAKLSEGYTPNILVIGDTIVDRYVACDAVGMSNEAPVVVVKELENQDYVGGAGIVSAHVAGLGANCTYMSVTGKDNPASFVRSTLADYGVCTQLFEDVSRPTTFKIRYLVDNQKLFRVSRLKEHSLTTRLEEQLIQKIEDLAPGLNAIIVSDFVYGVITDRVLRTLLSISTEYNLPIFGDLQCSSQTGNILRFKDFNLICPTEREARIALTNHEDGIEYVANLLIEDTRSSNMILKLGAGGFIAYATSQNADYRQRQHFPALTPNPVDVAGAGDALLAAMSVGISRGLSLMQAATFGCCVASLVVQTIGNKPVNLDQVKEFIYHREELSDGS